MASNVNNIHTATTMMLSSGSQAAQLKEEIKRVKQERQQAFIRHELLKEQQKNKIAHARKRWHKLQSRLGLHPYTEALKKEQEETTSLYAIKQQALVCKSLHRIEVYVKQLALLKKFQQSLEKQHCYDVAQLDATKLEIETKLLNRMTTVDLERNQLQGEYEWKLSQQRKEIRTLLQAAASSQPSMTSQSNNGEGESDWCLVEQDPAREILKEDDYYDDDQTDATSLSSASTQSNKERDASTTIRKVTSTNVGCDHNRSVSPPRIALSFRRLHFGKPSKTNNNNNTQRQQQQQRPIVQMV